MSIIPAISHPSWCDPRLCTTSASNVFHLSTPVEFEVTASLDDKRLTVGLEQRDEILRNGLVDTGVVTVRLTITDTASECHCGAALALDVALSTTDARFLMAALGVTVDKLETLLAVTR